MNPGANQEAPYFKHFWFLVFLLTCLWSLRPIWDMDLWWHLALGHFIDENGLPVVDPFALGREAEPWRTFQGGYEWFFHQIEMGMGLLGVRLHHAMAIGLGMALLGATAERLTQERLL